jgi:endoglucanase
VTAPATAEPTPSRLPRWRGFNLQEKFQADRNGRFREEDFAAIARWGLDFARLPLDYRCWTDEADPYALSEPVLAELDEAVALGERYGVHVSLNFHRAPGYCVNLPREPLDLWRSEEAQRLCAHHWAHLAERYRGVPNSRLTFNLVNEPKEIDDPTYTNVVRLLVAAIRARDPDRLIIADGLDLGWTPVEGIVDLGVAQSFHAYDPWAVSHWRAPWFPGADTWPEPTWPIAAGAETGAGVGPGTGARDRGALEERVALWKRVEAQGVGIHVGEFGNYSETPHAVTLAWMRDWLELLDQAGWGWAIWNLRGSYGPLDSGRSDVEYEDFEGHRLDRAMLDLILRH